MALKRNNLAAVVEDFAITYRTGSLDHLEERLDPNVIWEGIRPDLVCRNREEALEVLRSNPETRLDQVELIDAGDKVVLGLRSAEIGQVGDTDLAGQLFQVLTFEDGRIVRMQDFERREDALRAAGVADRAAWR